MLDLSVAKKVLSLSIVALVGLSTAAVQASPVRDPASKTHKVKRKKKKKKKKHHRQASAAMDSLETKGPSPAAKAIASIDSKPAKPLPPLQGPNAEVLKPEDANQEMARAETGDRNVNELAVTEDEGRTRVMDQDSFEKLSN